MDVEPPPATPPGVPANLMALDSASALSTDDDTVEIPLLSPLAAMKEGGGQLVIGASLIIGLCCFACIGFRNFKRITREAVAEAEQRKRDSVAEAVKVAEYLRHHEHELTHGPATKRRGLTRGKSSHRSMPLGRASMGRSSKLGGVLPSHMRDWNDRLLSWSVVKVHETLGHRGQLSRSVSVAEHRGHLCCVKQVEVQAVRHSVAHALEVGREVERLLLLAPHPHVLPVLGLVGDVMGCLVEGVLISAAQVSLYDLLHDVDGVKWSHHMSLGVGRDLARAMAFLHSRKIHHHHLKPANVLFDAKGVLKVSDYGLLHARGLEHLTIADMDEGTLPYLAPELAQRVSGGAPSDVWSFGCVLVHMQTRRPPYERIHHVEDDGFVHSLGLKWRGWAHRRSAADAEGDGGVFALLAAKKAQAEKSVQGADHAGHEHHSHMHMPHLPHHHHDDAQESPPPQPSSPPKPHLSLGTRCRHEKHGEGEVIEVTDEGNRKVQFDSGESHVYKRKSQHKLQPILSVGTRCRHEKHGEGEVIEVTSDGNRKVQFDSGESHVYKPKSQHKLKPVAPAATDKTNVNTVIAAATSLTASVAPSEDEAKEPTPRHLRPPTYYQEGELTAYMLLMRVVTGHTSPVDQLPTDGSVPPLLARLARACTALQPEKRPTFAAMAKIFEQEQPPRRWGETAQTHQLHPQQGTPREAGDASARISDKRKSKGKAKAQGMDPSALIGLSRTAAWLAAADHRHHSQGKGLVAASGSGVSADADDDADEDGWPDAMLGIGSDEICEESRPAARKSRKPGSDETITSRTSARKTASKREEASAGAPTTAPAEVASEASVEAVRWPAELLSEPADAEEADAVADALVAATDEDAAATVTVGEQPPLSSVVASAEPEHDFAEPEHDYNAPENQPPSVAAARAAEDRRFSLDRQDSVEDGHAWAERMRQAGLAPDDDPEKGGEEEEEEGEQEEGQEDEDGELSDRAVLSEPVHGVVEACSLGEAAAALYCAEGVASDAQRDHGDLPLMSRTHGNPDHRESLCDSASRSVASGASSGAPSLGRQMTFGRMRGMGTKRTPNNRKTVGFASESADGGDAEQHGSEGTGIAARLAAANSGAGTKCASLARSMTRRLGGGSGGERVSKSKGEADAAPGSRRFMSRQLTAKGLPMPLSMTSRATKVKSERAQEAEAAASAPAPAAGERPLPPSASELEQAGGGRSRPEPLAAERQSVAELAEPSEDYHRPADDGEGSLEAWRDERKAELHEADFRPTNPQERALLKDRPPSFRSMHSMRKMREEDARRSGNSSVASSSSETHNAAVVASGAGEMVLEETITRTKTSKGLFRSVTETETITKTMRQSGAAATSSDVHVDDEIAFLEEQSARLRAEIQELQPDVQLDDMEC